MPTRNPKLQTQNCEPENRNPKFKTRNPEPETRNPERIVHRRVEYLGANPQLASFYTETQNPKPAETRNVNPEP